MHAVDVSRAVDCQRPVSSESERRPPPGGAPRQSLARRCTSRSRPAGTSHDADADGPMTATSDTFHLRNLANTLPSGECTKNKRAFWVERLLLGCYLCILPHHTTHSGDSGSVLIRRDAVLCSRFIKRAFFFTPAVTYFVIDSLHRCICHMILLCETHKSKRKYFLELCTHRVGATW